MDKESLRPFIKKKNALCTIPFLPKEQQRAISLTLAQPGTVSKIHDILRKKIKAMHDIVISGVEIDPEMICCIEKHNYSNYKVSYDGNYILISNLFYKLIERFKYELVQSEYGFSNKDKLTNYDNDQKKLMVYNLPSLTMLYSVPCESVTNWIFNEKDSLLAVIDKNNKINLYNGLNGALLMTFANARRYSEKDCVLFHPNSTQMITRSLDPNKIVIWDAATDNAIPRNQPILLNANVVTFNRDGSLLAVANGKITELYKSENLANPIKQFLNFKANNLHFSSDNKRLLVEKTKPCRDNSKKVIYDIESQAEIYKDTDTLQKKVNSSLDRVALQGQLVMAIQEKDKGSRGKVIALNDNALTYSLSQTKSKFLLFDPSGDYLITEAPFPLTLNYVLLRNARTGAIISYLPHGYENGVPLFSNGGKKLVTNTGTMLHVWQLNPFNLSLLESRQKAAFLWCEYKYRHGQKIEPSEVVTSNSVNDSLLSFNVETEKIAESRYIKKICYEDIAVDFKTITKTKKQAMEGDVTELVGTTQIDEFITARKVKTGPFAGVTTAVRQVFMPSSAPPTILPIDSAKAKALFFAMSKKLKELNRAF